MNLEYGRLISRGFSITWRHRWLWLLGLFGGGGAGGLSFRYPTGPPPGGYDIINRYLGLILAVLAAVVVLYLVAVVIAWIATPAVIWSALQLDAGHGASLGQAWKHGLHRFWRYGRLALVTFAIYMGLTAGIVVLAVVVFLAFQISIVVGVLAVVAAVILALVALVVLGLGLRWAPYLLVDSDLHAIPAISTSWNMFKRHKLDTFVIGLLLGIVTFAISIASFVVAALVSIPGIVMLVAGFQGDWNRLLIGAGALWILLLGGAVLVVTSGFMGALGAVVNTLACRDLCWMDGVAPRVEGLPEPPPAPTPAPGMMPPPASWAPSA